MRRHLLLSATLCAAFGALLACGQHTSDKPADQALADRDLRPVGDAPQRPASPHGGGAVAGEGQTTWQGIAVTVPDGWQSQQPSSSMRVAQYAVPPAHGGAGAELAVFPGPMGSVEDNVTRWIGQFSQADGSPAAGTAKRWTMETDGGYAATMLEVYGTFDGGMGMGGGGPQTDQGMLGAIAERGGSIFYLKLTGPRAEIADLGDDFEGLVRSIGAN